MKKLSLVSLLVLSLLLTCFEAPTLAQSAKSNSVQKTPTVSGSDTKTKSNKKSKTKSTKKSKTKSTKKSKTKSTKKSKTKSTKKSKSTKKGSAKTKSSKTVSRSTNKSFDVSRILSLGMSLKGTPYKYGGRSPKGFDCSGFTSYVFQNAAGITLPRTSSGQASAGTHVARADLQPGDLVYFNTNGKGISHVGIYIGGDNFIHASRTKGITVTSLNDSYYKPRYLGAARVR